MKELFRVVIVAVLLVAKPASADEYAFVLKGRGNPFWKVIVDGIKTTAAERGVEAAIFQLENDQDAEAQLNLCLTALERKPKFMVLGAITKPVGIQCYREAMKRGVLAGDIDGNLSVAEARKDGIAMTFSVGSDNYKIGESAAKFVSENSSKRNPRVFVLAGLTGNVVSQRRVSGFTEGLRRYLPEAVIVATLAGDWDRLKGANVTSDILQREDSLDFIFSASDIMTYGIIESIKLAGREKEITVVSVDGNADIRDAVIKGRVRATVAQLPYLMGKRAVELSITAGSGGAVPEEEFTPTPILTKDVLESGDKTILQYVR